MLKIQAFTIGLVETNCYLVYDDKTKEALLIDPADYDKQIRDYIKGHDLDVKFIVHTHGHYDHIGGDKEFGYPILIHEKDKGCLSNPLRSLSFSSGGSLHRLVPHRLLKDQDIINIKNLSFKVIHLPGHTPGGIALECGKALFTGDTLFCEGIGRTDIPYADGKELEKSLEKLMNYSDDTVIYPGHGPTSTIGHERRNNPFLVH